MPNQVKIKKIHHSNHKNHSKKKPQTYKPDFVLRQAGVPVIYLVPIARDLRCLPPLLSRLPGKLCERHNYKVYMAFQPARFIPPFGYPNRSCALTARFHPYPETGAVIFCDTFFTSELLRKFRLLGGAVLCVVRTFLPERRQSGLRFFYFNGTKFEIIKKYSQNI